MGNSMYDRIYRVTDGGADLRVQPDRSSALLVQCEAGQAVALMDPKLNDGWGQVFVDTPGVGLFIGYLRMDMTISVLEENAIELPVNAPVTPDASTRLSPNFTLGEFIKSASARKHGIENMPDAAALANLKHTAAMMQQVRQLLGDHAIIVTSGYRGPELNRIVGGSAKSAHLTGHAIDFVCPDFGTPFQICEKIKTSAIMADVDQMIHEKGTWVHISFAPEKRGHTLTYGRFGADDKLSYQQGIINLDGDFRPKVTA